MSFDEAVHAYERNVQTSLKAIGGDGGGSFEIVIDEAAAGHMISWPAFTDTILPALQRPRPPTEPRRQR